MKKFRIIPILLFKNNSIVKSVQFEKHRVVGDVQSTIKVFARRQADEMIILDLDAHKSGQFNRRLLDCAVEFCNMPLTMGGGIRSVEQAGYLIESGCDKVSLNTLLFEQPREIAKIARRYGVQAVVGIVDYRTINGEAYIFSDNGTKQIEKLNVPNILEHLSGLGVGEVVFNHIDRDGMMQGYDLGLCNAIFDNCKIPVLLSGGCQSAEDIYCVEQAGFSGACAGSIFYWKGDSIPSLKKELLIRGGNVRTVI